MRAVGQRLPVEGHVDQVGQGDNKNDRAEIDGQDPDAFAEHLLHEQRQQNGARTGGEHSQKHSTGSEHRRHGQSKQNHRRQTEVAEIMGQAPSEHLHDVRRAGDVNLKVSLVQLMHHALQTEDEFLGIAGLGKHDDIGGLAVFGYQQPVPERARQCILKTLWPGGQTLDRADRVDRLDLLSEPSDPVQVSG